MSRVVVRRATEDDIGALAALRRAWVEEDAGPIVDGGAYEHEFAAWYRAEGERRLTWVALADDEPVGMLSMLEYRRMPRPDRLHSRWGYVSNVFVLAAHRDGGIGRQLLDAVLAIARDREYARLVLSPSERARSLYGRVGFGPADELMVLPLH